MNKLKEGVLSSKAGDQSGCLAISTCLVSLRLVFEALEQLQHEDAQVTHWVGLSVMAVSRMTAIKSGTQKNTHLEKGKEHAPLPNKKSGLRRLETN